MSYLIIIRGPLGSGKTTIAKLLSKKLKAKYIAVDKVVDNDIKIEWEEGYISQKTFKKANDIISKQAKTVLKKGKIVIFDGNFYWKSSISNLISKLKNKYFIFTLKAPLKVCIDRDKKRKKPCGKDAAFVVYKKTNSFKIGTIINTNNKTPSKVVNDILKILK